MTPHNELKQRTKRQPGRLPLVSAIVVFLVLIPIWWQSSLAYEGQLLTLQRERLSQIVVPYSNTVSTVLSQRLSLLNGLFAFANTEREVASLDAEFDEFARALYESTSGVKSLAIAPDGIQQYIYPLEGNESAIGYDALADPRPHVREAVNRAIETGEIVFSGPYALGRDNVNMTARKAVYDDDGALWGLVTITLDLTPLLEEAGLIEATAEFDIALVYDSHVLFGDQSLLDENPVVAPIQVPDDTWLLAAVPAGGWPASISLSLRLVQLGGLVFISAMSVLAFAIVQRQVRLSRQASDSGQQLAKVSDQLQGERDRMLHIEGSMRDQQRLVAGLRDSAATLITSLDPAEVLNRILENVWRVLPHDAANIAMIENDAVRVTHTRGYSPTVDAYLRHLRIPLETPNYHQMFITGEACVISNTSAPGSSWDNWPETSGIRSYVGVPIRAHGQVIGFLNFDSTQPGYFTDAHTEELQAFADQAAIAIENAQLYDQIRRHAQELEQRVALRTSELESERTQLQAILDSMGEAVIYTEELSARYVNWRLPIITGYSPEELNTNLFTLMSKHMLYKGKPLADQIPRLANSLDKHNLWKGEVRIQRKNGSWFDASLTVTLVSPPGISPVSTVALVRDISQEKALQEQKDRFIANASHELRTPIANMKMRLYLLRKQPDKFDNHMEVMETVTSRMENLVEELLDVSRFERGVISLQPQTTDVRELLATATEIQRPLAAARSVQLITEFPPGQMMIEIDANRIIQVVTNLITNAINYTSGGGSVRVQLTEQPDNVTISITDTGIGIPSEFHKQIFEPFFRIDEGIARGTGLGLTISREIILLHGGAIHVQSEVNQGSTFTVELPRSQTDDNTNN